METGEVNRQARGGARGSLGGGNPITADQLASAIASAQSVLGMAPPPPSPGTLVYLINVQDVINVQAAFFKKNNNLCRM